MTSKIKWIAAALFIAYTGKVILEGHGNYHGISIPKEAGLPVLFIACIIGVIALASKSYKTSAKICPKCLIVDQEAQEETTCAHCSGPLVPLKGFFDKNPHLRNSQKGEPAPPE